MLNSLRNKGSILSIVSVIPLKNFLNPPTPPPTPMYLSDVVVLSHLYFKFWGFYYGLFSLTLIFFFKSYLKILFILITELEASAQILHRWQMPHLPPPSLVQGSFTSQNNRMLKFVPTINIASQRDLRFRKWCWERES